MSEHMKERELALQLADELTALGYDELRFAAAGELRHLVSELLILRAKVEGLKAEMEEVALDAQRYRWLRDSHGDWGICEWDYESGSWTRDARGASVVDHVVDKARSVETSRFQNGPIGLGGHFQKAR